MGKRKSPQPRSPASTLPIPTQENIDAVAIVWYTVMSRVVPGFERRLTRKQKRDLWMTQQFAGSEWYEVVLEATLNRWRTLPYPRR
jgi:hypothetical protein